MAQKNKLGEIALGGGCFWCSEAIFSRLKGVVKVTSGYAGGNAANPTYEQVCSGKTGHAEVVKVEYNPKVAKIENIFELFFAMHDPTTKDRQGNDVGSQYRSIILYTSPEQKKAAESYVKKAAVELAKPIVTEISKLENFYPAEDYHLQYYDKNKFQPYCAFVISPTLHKLKEPFGLLCPGGSLNHSAFLASLCFNKSVLAIHLHPENPPAGFADAFFAVILKTRAGIQCFLFLVPMFCRFSKSMSCTCPSMPVCCLNSIESRATGFSPGSKSTQGISTVSTPSKFLCTRKSALPLSSRKPIASAEG